MNRFKAWLKKVLGITSPSYQDLAKLKSNAQYSNYWASQELQNAQLLIPSSFQRAIDADLAERDARADRIRLLDPYTIGHKHFFKSIPLMGGWSTVYFECKHCYLQISYPRIQYNYMLLRHIPYNPNHRSY